MKRGRPPLPAAQRQHHIQMRAEAIFVFDHFCERQRQRIMRTTLGIPDAELAHAYLPEDIDIRYREERLGPALHVSEYREAVTVRR
jgi:hypothetical protein